MWNVLKSENWLRNVEHFALPGTYGSCVCVCVYNRCRRKLIPGNDSPLPLGICLYIILRTIGRGRITPIPWWRRPKVRAVKGWAGELLDLGVCPRSWARLFLLSRPAHHGLWHEDLGEEVEGRYFIGCQKAFSYVQRVTRHSTRGLGTWVERKAGFSESISKARRWAVWQGGTHSVPRPLFSCWAIQKNDVCNLILIICKVGTVTAYLLGMWQGILNWNDHKALSQVYKVLRRTNTEINTDVHVLFLGSLFLRTKKRLPVSMKTFAHWAIWTTLCAVKFTYKLLQGLQTEEVSWNLLIAIEPAIGFQLNVPIEYIALFSFMWKFCPDFNSLWPMGRFSPSGFNSICLWLIPWCSSPFLLSLAEYAAKCKCLLVCLLI